jgi:hypothetical protein
VLTLRYLYQVSLSPMVTVGQLGKLNPVVMIVIESLVRLGPNRHLAPESQERVLGAVWMT